MRNLISVLVLIFVVGVVHAATICVPQDQLTIQAGIDVAANGDTVLVDDGIYTGLGNVNINFNGKAITVTSVSGAQVTVIDCEEILDTRGVAFENGETNASVFNGFTIKNGNIQTAGNGGGIICENSSSPTITN